MEQNSRLNGRNLESHIPSSSVASYPVRGGNTVTPLIDGVHAFRRICEAIEAARHSVWGTVAFMDPDFEMPDGRGSLFDVLDRAKARGLDVRVIFWRMNDDIGFSMETVFSGTPEHRKVLSERGSNFHIRWDRAHKAYCQHQKSWLMDAGQSSETVFVGGINLDTSSVVLPGHDQGNTPETHDIYLELRGPSASDVHHNFVQRWNEASERAIAGGFWPDHAVETDLKFPVAASTAAGEAFVQIQRTVRAGHYTDMSATPGGSEFPIHQGEFSIFDQYLKAIDAAKRTIYIEDQSIGAPEFVEKLAAALSRGVDVVFLMPAQANGLMREWRLLPKSKPFFDQLAALGQYENFTLAGIAATGSDGVSRDIYVHAKIALIDDHWATIGSCNIGARSFFGDTELNASFWAPDVVRALRCDLFAEHLGVDTSALDDRKALGIYRQTARANFDRRQQGQKMEGSAFSIDPATYAM